MNNWSIRSAVGVKDKTPAAIGPREHVKTVIAANTAVPEATRAAFCALIDALPATVNAVKLDAHEHTDAAHTVVGNYTLKVLY